MVVRLTLGRGSLATAGDTQRTLESTGQGAPQELMLALHDLGHHSEVINHLGRALAAELPIYPRDGGFIAAEYLPQLDELRELRDAGRRLTAGLQSRYTGETSSGAASSSGTSSTTTTSSGASTGLASSGWPSAKP